MTSIDLINRRDTSPVDFPSSSLIETNRDSRSRHFIVEGQSSLKMFATHCVTRELAPRGGFEPPTFRLTAEQPIQSELAGVGANRGNSARCDETGRITFSFFIHLSFAFSHRSPPLVLRFHDGRRRRADIPRMVNGLKDQGIFLIFVT